MLIGSVRRAVRLLRAAAGRLSVWPVVGLVRFGSFRRIEPIAPMWPPRYGRPVDRYYIDAFLESALDGLGGELLEVGNLEYTERFGGSAITGRSTLHAPAGASPGTTYVCDLADGTGLPSDRFDVIVLPQTLLFIYDVGAAVANLHRALRPGGRVLVTVPGISQIVPDDREMWGQYWSFTVDSLQRLFGDVFGSENIEISSFGNVKTAVSLLHGLAVEDLQHRDFTHVDPDYPVILTVVAVRPATDREANVLDDGLVG